MKGQSQEKIAVIGHPISHSLSPVIHNAAFQHLGIKTSYERLDVPKDKVSELVQKMRDMHMRQFAVTIPNKEVALNIADSASEIAKHIGAANTLTRMQDETIHADNTDWIGVRDSLSETENWNDKKALVLGAGGAARGVIHALQELGMNIAIKGSINNRPLSQAEKLAQHFGIQLVETGNDYDLVINVTPLGMKKADDPENVDKTAIDKHNLESGMTVFDTVMNPLETRLMREAREQDCHTIDGMRMLVYQGIEQLRIWTEVVDPTLSRKVISQKKELATMMRKAALEKLGITDTNS